MIPVKEAIEVIDKNIIPLEEKEKINVQFSNGHVLFQDVSSPINMPPFRQSAMDGYALLLQNDVTYTIIDEVKAGDNHNPVLKPGEAVRIFTGAAVPNSANAVIMQESVIVENNRLILQKPVVFGENIRPLGEQVKKGGVALRKGTKISPAAVGYLTSLGITEVVVFKGPSIAIVVTGSELVEAGHALTYGKIYESNSGMLLSALNSIGHTDVIIHKVSDDYAQTYSVLEKVIAQHDVILITGGISVGDYDVVGKVLQGLSVEQLFYKIKQKPGKPFFFGKKNKTIVFGLPGNPAAVLSCFYIYIYPALQKISGDIGFKLPRITVKSGSNFIKKGDNAQFLKAILKDGEATILKGQSSAMLQTFALANAMVYMPEEQKEISMGDLVEVIRLPI
ncbi:molybdopterin molybdotransferase MoeA [Arenibacter algicola]|uniref:molybdopterin molybdotransferase MoeA n=1 Tax=Arenibacter algicola TaxID=616991 RepID=UPI0004DF5A53|nr:gephyrin-like molybdotransferase Glp [Arenibacter algicola]